MRFNADLVIETLAWRANPDRGEFYCSGPELAEANRISVRVLDNVRSEQEPALAAPIIATGCCA